MAVDTHGNPTPVSPGETIEASHHTAVVARVVGTYPTVADRDIGRPNPNVGEVVHVESIPGAQVWTGTAWANIRDERTFAHSHSVGDLPPLDYLPLTGGTLTGQLQIVGVTNAILTNSGHINLGGGRLISVGDATQNTDAVNRQFGDARYIRDTDRGDFLAVAGDTMTGTLFMGTTTGTASVRNAVGDLENLPFSFYGDSNTGMRRVGNDRLGFVTGGVQAWEINGGGHLEASGALGNVRAGNGTAAAPAFSFDGDNDTGMYRSGTNNLSFATAGVQRLLVSGTRIETKEHLVVGTSGHSLGWRFSPGIGTGDYQAYLDDDGSGDWTWRVGTTSSSRTSKKKRTGVVDVADIASRFLSVPLRKWEYTKKHLDEVGVPDGSPNRGRVHEGYIAEELGEAMPELCAVDDETGVARIKDGRPLTTALIATIQHLAARVEALEEQLA